MGMRRVGANQFSKVQMLPSHTSPDLEYKAMSLKSLFNNGLLYYVYLGAKMFSC